MWHVIYCLKITLFRNQMLDLALVSEDKLNLICILASFYAFSYRQHRIEFEFIIFAQRYTHINK